MTGSHIDTVRTGGRFDGNLGVLAGLEVVETLEQHGVATDATVRRGVLHRRGGRPLPARHARQPGATSAGMALEEALDVVAARRRCPARRRAGPHRLRRADAVPDGGAAARVRRAAHRAGPGARGRRASRSAPSPACRASRGPSSRSPASRPTPAPRRCALRHDPAFVAAAIVTFVRDLAGELGGAQVATVGRIELSHRTSSTSCRRRPRSRVDLRNTDEAVLVEAEAPCSTSSSTSSPAPRG